MSESFRLVKAESLDYLQLSTGFDANPGATGATGPTGSIGGPMGAPGASPTGATGPTGTQSTTTLSLFVFFNSFVTFPAGNFMRLANSTTTTETIAQFVINRAAQFNAIYIYHESAPTDPCTYTLRIDGADTGLTVTSAVSGYASATAIVGVSAGDRYSVQMTSLSTGPRVYLTLQYVNI